MKPRKTQDGIGIHLQSHGAQHHVVDQWMSVNVPQAKKTKHHETRKKSTVTNCRHCRPWFFLKGHLPLELLPLPFRFWLSVSLKQNTLANLIKYLEKEHF